jgi:hypothetical protein
MELIIEAFEPKERDLVREELVPFLELIEKAKPDIPIRQIVIPEDFEEKIHTLTGSRDYRSSRLVGNFQVNAVAKILSQVNPPTIVLSPFIYSEKYDTQVRLFVIVHELIHSLNSIRFNPIPDAPYSQATYLQNLHVFLDEYFADRAAYEIVDGSYKVRSEHWLAHLEADKAGFAQVLLDAANKEKIRVAIRSFRFHGDVMQFLKEIHPTFDGVFLSIAHALSLNDQFPDESNWDQIQASAFVRSRSDPLFEFARKKFNARDYEYEDGVDLIAEYMEVFGFRLEDQFHGPYCHVLDI